MKKQGKIFCNTYVYHYVHSKDIQSSHNCSFNVENTRQMQISYILSLPWPQKFDTHLKRRTNKYQVAIYSIWVSQVQLTKKKKSENW